MEQQVTTRSFSLSLSLLTTDSSTNKKPSILQKSLCTQWSRRATNSRNKLSLFNQTCQIGKWNFEKATRSKTPPYVPALRFENLSLQLFPQPAPSKLFSRILLTSFWSKKEIVQYSNQPKKEYLLSHLFSPFLTNSHLYPFSIELYIPMLLARKKRKANEIRSPLLAH